MGWRVQVWDYMQKILSGNSLKTEVSNTSPIDVDINNSIPAGANVIGSIKVTDGTNEVGVLTTNGNHGLVVIEPNHISTANSTTALLGANATFLGTAEDITNYAIMFINAYSNVASATNGLCIEVSHDGVDWHTSECYTIIAGKYKIFTHQCSTKYFRIKYTNGGVAQTDFHIEVKLCTKNALASSHRISDVISGEDDAALIKAVITGQRSDGLFDNVSLTNGSNMKVSIEELESGISSNSNSQLNVTPFDTAGNELFSSGTPGYIQIGNSVSPNLDAFGRLRVSEPTCLFESQNQYDVSPLYWETALTGGGTVVHLPNESSVRMRVTTASGDKVIRQTKRYFRYQAGKSHLVEMTGVMGAIKTNVRQRIGYFDVANGLFFEQDGVNLKIVKRTYTSGVAVDSAVNQSSWNIDKLDGTGKSGLTLDMSKAQIFLVDLQWLGVGRVRYGFVIDGMLIYVHEVLNANILEEVYMSTANLPLRYELENTGVTASQTDMKHICSAVMSEGGYEEDFGITHSANNGLSPITTSARRPILSIRPKATYNGIVNRSSVAPVDFDLYVTTNPILYEVVFNGTLTGSSFNSSGDNSVVEYDVASTTISGGEILSSGYIVAGAGVRTTLLNIIKNKLFLSNNIAGNSTDVLSIVITPLTGNATVASAINWKEIY